MQYQVFVNWLAKMDDEIWGFLFRFSTQEPTGQRRPMTLNTQNKISHITET